MPLIQKERLSLKWSNYRRFSYGDVSLHAPQRPGVYALFVGSSSTGFSVFYVGRAGDLRSRLKDHLSSFEPNVGLRLKVATEVTYFRYALLPEAPDRDKAERALILKYKPEYNDIDQVPDCPGVEVDIN